MIHTLGLSPSLDVVYTADAVTIGAIHRPRSVLRLAGGKSLNVARALARLGRPVRAIAPLGGRLGDLVAELIPAEVQLDRIEVTGPTRMCVSVADPTTGGLTEFYEPAPTSDGTELVAIVRSIAEIAPGEWLTLSGSVPPGVDLASLAAGLRRCSAAGVRLGLDVHGPALGFLLAQTAPQLVKVNRSEASEVVGPADDLVALARLVLDRGPSTVVITDGPAGAVAAATSGRAWHVTTDGPPGGFPVGSGDCFLAGLVCELDRGSAWPEALALANAVGTANAAEPGGGVFDLAMVAALRERTHVREDGRADPDPASP